MSEEKKSKSVVVSTRLTADEYAEIQLRIMNERGEAMMSVSEYLKTALLNASVQVKDKEVEQYAVFVLNRLSMDLNKLVTTLTAERLAGRLSESIYRQYLVELNGLNQQLRQLSEPLR